MRTHVIFGHTHDHGGKCKIKDGYTDGSFVLYNNKQNKHESQIILTLGGSTTDGFFHQFSSGNTWPYFASKFCSNCQVINGGVGAYGSTQELLKLLADGSALDKKIDFVISLNGINDLPNYNYYSDHLMKKYPFYNEIGLSMMDGNKYITQNRSSYSKYFPNIVNLAHHIGVLFNYELTNKDDKKKILNSLNSKELVLSLGDNSSKVKSSAVRWFNNVKMMHAISKEMGAKYMVFLQPTAGLIGIQSNALKDSNDEKIIKWMFKNRKDYVISLRDTYSMMISLCSKLEYCYDITDTAPPLGDMYFNNRHHNANGNKVIAKKIMSVVNNSSKY
jgi:hypothetical protein